MLAAVKVKSKPDQVPSNSMITSSTGRLKKALKVYDEDNIPTISKEEALKNGIVNIPSNKTNAPYNILLVGETGVGKSSLMELIANILTCNDIDHYNFEILDHTNEQDGSGHQSQTNSARLYEFTSKNGIVVRILDTPGLLDTRRPQQTELHRKNISTQVKKHLDYITAVLVLVNGTVTRSTGGLHHAFSALSTIIPKTMANNVAFVFTNIVSPLSWNFCQDTIPEVLKSAPQFQLDNPIALQRKCLKLKEDPAMEQQMTTLHREVKDGEQNALKMLVDLFDWLGGLEPQAGDEGCPLQGVTAMIASPPALMV